MAFSAPAKEKLGVRTEGKVTKPKPHKERLLKGVAAALGSGVLVETPAGRSTAADPSIEQSQPGASVAEAEKAPLALAAELPGISAPRAALKLEAQPSGEVLPLNTHHHRSQNSACINDFECCWHASSSTDVSQPSVGHSQHYCNALRCLYDDSRGSTAQEVGGSLAHAWPRSPDHPSKFTSLALVIHLARPDQQLHHGVQLDGVMLSAFLDHPEPSECCAHTMLYHCQDMVE